jgi:hypothetical protein
MKRQLVLCGVIAAVGVVLSTATTARAQDTVMVVPPPAAETTMVRGYTGPNTPLLKAGVVGFAFSYLPGVFVASQSSQSADNNLYIPVVGPWMDIAHRPTCGVPGGPACNTESAAKGAIAVSGAFQGLGVLVFALGLALPDHEILVAKTARTGETKVSVSAVSIGADGYGVAAVGSW